MENMFPKSWESSPPTMEELQAWRRDVYQPAVRQWLERTDPAKKIREAGDSSAFGVRYETPENLLPELVLDGVDGKVFAEFGVWGSTFAGQGVSVESALDALRRGSYIRLAAMASPMPGTVIDAREPYSSGILSDLQGAGGVYLAPWNLDVWATMARLGPSDTYWAPYLASLDDALMMRDEVEGIDWPQGGAIEELKGIWRDIAPILSGIPAVLDFAASGGTDIGALAGGLGDVLGARREQVDASVAESLGRATGGQVADSDPTMIERFIKWWRQAAPQLRWRFYAAWYMRRYGRWPQAAPRSIYSQPQTQTQRIR